LIFLYCFLNSFFKIYWDCVLKFFNFFLYLIFFVLYYFKKNVLRLCLVVKGDPGNLKNFTFFYYKLICFWYFCISFLKCYFQKKIYWNWVWLRSQIQGDWVPFSRGPNANGLGCASGTTSKGSWVPPPSKTLTQQGPSHVGPCLRPGHNNVGAYYHIFFKKTLRLCLATRWDPGNLKFFFSLLQIILFWSFCINFLNIFFKKTILRLCLAAKRDPRKLKI
jgi:hypothetical protein